MIRRGGKDLGLLVGRDEAWALLGDRTFNPQVMHSKGSVSIWLPELEVYGQGPTYALATTDLLEEIRVYVEEYLAEVPEIVCEALSPSPFGAAALVSRTGPVANSRQDRHRSLPGSRSRNRLPKHAGLAPRGYVFS